MIGHGETLFTEQILEMEEVKKNKKSFVHVIKFSFIGCLNINMKNPSFIELQF